MAEESERKEKYEKMFSEEAREHYRNARKEMRESIKALFPAEFRERRQKARKEMLLAWRTIIDDHIKRIENEK